MNGQLARPDALLRARLLDELDGKRFALSIGHQPAHDITTEDVENDVELKEHPFGRSTQLGDVPRPHLTRRCSEQFWLRVVRPAQLVTPFPNLSRVTQDAIHRGDRTKVPAFVEQRR